MDDKLKIFWNLDVLVKMSRSKSDGPSLRIEENELKSKIKIHNLEIEEIKTQSEEESYDTSAEMADRNIEIITKKQLQTLKILLKEKNSKLSELKETENNLYKNTSLLRDTKISYEKYISSMQDRIGEATEYDVIDRYNALIAETSEKISNLNETIKEESMTYEDTQQEIINLTEEINNIEEQIDKKKKLLAETQSNLENKENYIDKTKKEKNNKKIKELEDKISKLEKRVEEIHNDPKYIETKIKDVINNNEDPINAKDYLVTLVNMVIDQPYINVPTDNALEEELLKATQARDTFANEIDQKSYNILEAETPEKIRIEFLKARIAKWKKELDELRIKISAVDKDQEFNYEEKDQIINEMIINMKKDLKEFEKAYNETPDINIGAKASIKVALDEKREDVLEAEKIATAFRKDESDDIARTTRVIKYECEQIKANIKNAEVEIATIKNRLTSKKSGAIDITSRNKDKDKLKELAQTVIDIKHRRQFAETPLEIVKRLEKDLKINIIDEINQELINATSTMKEKDYNEYQEQKKEELFQEVIVETELNTENNAKRGIKVITETQIAPPQNVSSEEIEEVIDNKLENNDISSDLFTDTSIDKIIEETEKTTEFIEENQNENNTAELMLETEEAPIKEEIDEPVIEIKKEEPLIELQNEEPIIELTSEENFANEEENLLDIGAIVEAVQPKEEPEQELSINSLFNENEENKIRSEDLTSDLDEYLNNLDKKES